MFLNRKFALIAFSLLALNACKKDSDGKTRAMSPTSAGRNTYGGSGSAQPGRFEIPVSGSANLEPLESGELYQYDMQESQDADRAPRVFPDSRYRGFFPRCAVEDRSGSVTLVSVDEGRKAMVKVNGRLEILRSVTPARRHPNLNNVGPFGSRENFPVERGDSYERVYRQGEIVLTMTHKFDHPMRGPLRGCRRPYQAKLRTKAILRVGRQITEARGLTMNCQSICSSNFNEFRSEP